MNLTDLTIKDLRLSFENYNHRPSPQMWEALTDVARRIEQMAEGKLDPGTFYVSSLDPGVGKTQTIAHAIRNLRREVGVLICVSRLDEIKTLIAEMGLTRPEVGVYTGDDETNVLGSTNPDAARVMFTTQQMVDSRLKDGRRFEDLDVFFFQGRPRGVRIWDEAMLPGLELTLNVDAISRLPSLLRKVNYNLAEGLLDLVEDLREAIDCPYSMLDIEGRYGVEFKDLKPVTDSWLPRDRDTADTLWRMSGKVVTVCVDPNGNTILDYREHLPDDFAPVLILDASARVRATYSFWRDSRGNLVELTKANKRYDNRTVHHWNKGGGKSSFRNKQQTSLIEGVASAINSKPDENWLVVVHKEDGYKIPDLSKSIGDLVSGDRSRVSYITWGEHQATNAYVKIKNVILAGVLFYPRSVYEVRARASKALQPHELLEWEDYRKLELGEHSHLILQAACRGAVRKCIGHHCAPCDLYLIAAHNTGIPSEIEKIFPGCRMVPWMPIDQPLKGKVGKAVEYLSEEFHEDSNKHIAFADHRSFLGITNKANYNRVIRKHPLFVQAREKMNIVEVAPNGKYLSHYAVSHF